MGSLLVQVRTKLALHVRRKARGPLPGEYSSIHKGRSMDFDDLREYQRGDDVKDIDWKSSARTGSVLLKRYVAVRKHHVLLVVDTGRAMTAVAADGTPKRDLAVLVAGALGSVVVGHGDLVGLLAGDERGRRRAPWRSGSVHLEELLRAVYDRIDSAGAPADVVGLLRRVRDDYRRRLVVAVVTDEGGWDDEVAALLRRLRVQHDIIWFTILDADLLADDLADRNLVDVVSAARLPATVRDDPALREEYAAAVGAVRAARRRELSQLGVHHADVDGEAAAIPAVLRLVERSRRATA